MVRYSRLSQPVTILACIWEVDLGKAASYLKTNLDFLRPFRRMQG
jgi:hypothetical protein